MMSILKKAFRNSYLAALLLIGLSAEAQVYTKVPGYFEWFGGRFTYGLRPPVRDTVSDAGKIDSVGTLIYRPTDDAVYIKTSIKWVKVGIGDAKNNVVVVDNVSSLASLTGSPDSLVLVKDQLRGGLFYWSSTGNPDNGVTFSGASGFWNRVLPGSWVDAAWWGAVGDGTTVGQQVPINSAINYCTTHDIKQAIVRTGHYLLNGSIRLKNNVHLAVNKNALMELVPGGNAYIVTNDDLVNGNSNIEISGGEWVGNGYQQTLNGGSGIPDIPTNFLGFGFQFYLVKGLNVHDLQVDSTRTWAIAHIGCQYVTFRNIRLLQNLRTAENGDGITGSSSDVLFENISGYTNDDMIGINASRVGFGTVLPPGPYYPVFDINNVTVRNVTAERFPGSSDPNAATWRPIRIFANKTARVTNVLVENVKGMCLANPIQIDAHDPDNTGDFNRAGYMENIQIRNVSCEAGTNETGRVRGYVGIEKLIKLNNLSISGITRREKNLTFYPTIGITRSAVNNLDVANVEAIYPPGSTGPFMRDSLSTVNSINLNNIYSSDSTFTSATPLYRKYADVSSTATHINARNIRIVATTTNGITTNNASQAKISLNSTDFRSDTIQLRGQDYDHVNHLGVGPFYYLNGRWNGMNSAAFIQNQTAAPQTANFHINGVGAMNTIRIGYNGFAINPTKVIVGFNPTNSSNKLMQINMHKDTINDNVLDSVGGIFMARINADTLTVNTTENGYGYTRAGSTLGNIFGAGADSTVGASTGRVSLTSPVARIGMFADSDFRDHNTTSASMRFYTKALGSGGTNERMRITPTGNIGIGTTAPVSKLEVNGTITAPTVTSPTTADLTLSASSGQRVTLNTSGITRMAVKDDGTIDMGTVTPPFGGVLLNVGGNVQSNDAYILSDGTTNAELGMSGNSIFLRTVSNHPIYFKTNDIERLRILNTGEVGIGTATPVTPLQVAGSITGITEATADSSNLMASTAWVRRQLYGSGSGAVTSVNGQTGTVNLTTSEISEGSNLYYTDTRARAALSAGTGIGYSSGTGVISNTAPDQTVSLASGTGISVTGTYPNFTVTNAGITSMPTWQQVTTVGAVTTNPVTVGSTTTWANLILNAPVNTFSSRILFQAGGGNRWLQTLTGTESGSNAGANLTFNSRTDAGANLLDVLTLQRTGNVGIGTTSPGAKLEVAGQLKITGGSPAAGKILTSDASGLGTWGYRAVTIVAATNNYTVQDGDYFIMMNGPVGSGTLTLPTASSYTGRELVITEVAGNTITFSSNIMKPGTGSVPTITNQTYHVISDGVQWRIISMYQ